MPDIVKTIAIDFDGTLTEDSPYPITGDIRPEMKQLVSDLSRMKGVRLVLNTCRKGSHFYQALSLLKQNDMYGFFDWDYLFDCRNRGECGKLIADIYLDDRTILFDSIPSMESILKKLRSPSSRNCDST